MTATRDNGALVDSLDDDDGDVDGLEDPRASLDSLGDDDGVALVDSLGDDDDGGVRTPMCDRVLRQRRLSVKWTRHQPSARQPCAKVTERAGSGGDHPSPLPSLPCFGIPPR
ncbi:hypothetical protein ZWY2020_058868 [Hordeum vulgare]|nr:hypothetical protein ZWY2020_058868 [Hordeum vulgare]